MVDPNAVANALLAGLTAEVREAVARQAVAVANENGQTHDLPLSDIEIATVVSGARQKGICMRHIRRVDGPYPNGPSWRLRIVLRDGSRKYHSEQYPTEAAAERGKKALQEGIRRETGKTVIASINDYQTHLLQAVGNQPKSAETTIGRLKGFFAGHHETPLYAVDPKLAVALKAKLDARPSRQGAPGAVLSRETRRGTLAEVKTFMRWAAEMGYARPGAFDGIKLDQTRGRKVRRARGKPKLRDHERIRWWAAARELAGKGDEGALACMLCLDANLRSAEVLGRQVRDVEKGGKRLVIENGKTVDSDRHASIGDELAALLVKHAGRRDPHAPLFVADGRVDRKGWLKDHCVRICKLAAVPRVTPHGLRGTGGQATLMRVVMSMVQASMGHAPGTSVTRDHYLGADAMAEAERILARAN